jgi:hypothetical protein
MVQMKFLAPLRIVVEVVYRQSWDHRYTFLMCNTFIIIIITILVDFGIPMKLLRLIKMFLTETYSRVRVGKNLSDMFPIRNGLKPQLGGFR